MKSVGNSYVCGYVQIERIKHCSDDLHMRDDDLKCKLKREHQLIS